MERLRTTISIWTYCNYVTHEFQPDSVLYGYKMLQVVLKFYIGTSIDPQFKHVMHHHFTKEMLQESQTFCLTCCHTYVHVLLHLHQGISTNLQSKHPTCHNFNTVSQLRDFGRCISSTISIILRDSI